ncbi:MAG: DMT family transporter [Bacteriovoracaceae bacterium]|jgi:drug/metabolite transporter (DMT)-like permease
MKPHSLGIIQIILSGLMFSFIGLVGKIAFERGILSMELLGYRFVFSVAILFLYMMIFNRSLLKTSFKNILLFSALGIGGYSMMAINFFFALESISASLCVLLLYTYPIIVALIGHFFLNEKISKQKAIYFVLALIGLVMLVSGEIEVRQMQGLIFGLLSAIFYSLYIVLSKVYIKETPAFTAIFYVQLASAILAVSLSFTSFERYFSVIEHSYGLILFFALVSTLGAMVLFMAGLKKIKSWEASILSLAEPLFGVLLSVFFLGDQLNVLKVSGGLLVLVSLAFISLPQKNKI